MKSNAKPTSVYYPEANQHRPGILANTFMIFKKSLLALFCLVVFGMQPALAGIPGALPSARKVSGITAAKNKNSYAPAKLASVTRLLRLKLCVDANNYDDIAIGFNAGASALYNDNEDSRYMKGMVAPEGLSCYSSDGVALSVDLLPFPDHAQEAISLDIEAQNSGTITLRRTEFDSIPKIYGIWLMDKYKKDSIDLRIDSNYVFKVDKTDTATFGRNRFEVIVRQDGAKALKLDGFGAVKAADGAEIAWTTENENNDTNFAVERSSDQGFTFNVIDTLTSNGTGSYSFVDKALHPGPDQYRLKMQDLNGVVSYSSVVILDYRNTANSVVVASILIYPNPVNGFINVAIDKSTVSGGPVAISSVQNNGPRASFAAIAPPDKSLSYGIKIINITGSVIKTVTSVSPAWQGDVSGLPSGTYIVQVVNYTNNATVGRSTFIKL